MKPSFLAAPIAISLSILSLLAQPQLPASIQNKGVITNLMLTQSLEEMVREEMDRLDMISGFYTKVQLTDAATSTADPDGTISISRPELVQLQGKVAPKQFRQVLRFLLAHEKTHQIQYRAYTVAAVRANDPERRRLYEAQADVLAGKYLLETLGEPKPDDLVAIVDTLKLAFDLGTLEFSDTDHPSKEARRTAARLGMASGMITALSRLPPTPELGQMIASLAEKVNILRDENVMEWSYRTAKRITQYSRAASRDIVLLKERQIDWDERASNPFVTFRLIYENKGSRTIHIDMEVQCASVPRENSNDTLEWLKASVKNFSFDLKPGERYTASGKLQWIATQKLMPRIIYPPAVTALMSTEHVK